MMFWQRLYRFFGIGKNTPPQVKSTTDSNAYHWTEVVPQAYFGGQPNTFLAQDGKRIKTPDFSLEWLPVIRYLASFNQDVSQAVDNIINLASTRFDIYIEGASKTNENRMRQVIEAKRKQIYPNSLGYTSLINDLYRQIAINGALSTDYILDNRFKFKKVELLDPAFIYFSEENEAREYLPYQKIKTAQVELPNRIFGYQPLNLATFRYTTLQRDSESPYPVAPFLAALKSLGVQGNSLDNLDKVVEKIGLFGFLSVNIKAPLKRPAESDSDYQARLQSYLQAEGERMRSLKGTDLAVGYTDTHEFKMQNGNINAQNANILMGIIDTYVASGLKQDPALMGREKNTSEAFGRILYSKMMTQITTYQAIVADFMSDMFYVMLALEGFNLANVKIRVEFQEPILMEETKKEQAYALRLNNLTLLYNQGIIDQRTFAKEAGYEKPALEAPIQTNPTNPNANQPAPRGQDPTSTNVSENSVWAQILRDNHDRYAVPECYSQEANPPTPYENQVREVYDKAVRKIARQVGTELKKTNRKMSLASVQDLVISYWYRLWDREFSQKIDPIVDKQVGKYYRQARKDKSIFPPKAVEQSAFDTIPEAVFELLDYRVLEFMQTADKFYLGKFIQDEDTKKRILNYLQANYIESDTEIGSTPEAIAKIQSAIQEVGNLEAYKIARIINTTVNRLRNYGNLMYMSQAQVEKYKVVEVNDNLTCPHCKHLNGKIFSLGNTKTRLNRMISGEPEDVKNEFPFATAIDLADFQKMSVSDLETAKITLPAYHPNCRGRIVAEF